LEVEHADFETERLQVRVGREVRVNTISNRVSLVMKNQKRTPKRAVSSA
jgi:hypothetical protein